MKIKDSLYLESVDSSNDFLKNHANLKDLPSGFLVTAGEQKSGKGQRGKKWISEPGQNLLASIWIKDHSYDQLYLNKAVANSIYIVVHKVLDNFQIDDKRSLKIKWPNDLLWGIKKLSGILIEKVNRVDCSGYVIGVGLNVNQRNFDTEDSCSIILIAEGKNDLVSNKTIKIEDLALEIRQELFQQLKVPKSENHQFYSSKLFGKSKFETYESSDNKFQAKVLAVNDDGSIQLKLTDGTERAFKNGELSLVR